MESNPEKIGGEAPKTETPPEASDVELEGEDSVEYADVEYEDEGQEDVVVRPAPPAPKGPQFVFKRKITPSYDFPLAPPLLDPERSSKGVVLELDSRKFETDPLYMMRQSIKNLRDSRMSTLANLRRRQSVIFLNLILYPFIDGLADELQVSPEEQVRTMVRNTQTIGSLIARNRDAAQAVLNQPQIRIWSGLARPALEATDEEIRADENVEWWMDVVKRTRHEVWEVLNREQNGKWWLAESLVETLNFLKGVLTQ